VQEAVLLDSGFSTSLVYDKKIIVTGHTATNLPSRPVPHAIVVTGTLERPTDKGSQIALKDADQAVVPISPGANPGPDGSSPVPGVTLNSMGDPVTQPAAPTTHRKRKTHRRRRRAKTPSVDSAASPDSGAAAPSPPPDNPAPDGTPKTENPDK
jgi:hypothetical protein